MWLLGIDVRPGTEGWFDVLRVVTLVVGAALIAVVAVVAVRYTSIYRRHKRAQAAGRATAWRGLLPRHVALIGTSYIVLICTTLRILMEKFRDDPSLLGPILLLAYTLGFWAMWDVIGHQRHRSRDEPAP